MEVTGVESVPPFTASLRKRSPQASKALLTSNQKIASLLDTK